jgi:hypothetical protein
MARYVDIKVLVWNRIHIPDDMIVGEIVSEIEKTGDVYDWYNGVANELPSVETLCDTEEMLTVKENDGQNTIEIYDDDKLIWQNGANE